MIRTFILSLPLLFAFNSFASAEVILSETIRPQIKSLVNVNIMRLTIPATPNSMSLPTFGKDIIGWGTGPDGAEARLNTINAEDVQTLKKQSVTLDMIQAWQAFYENETRRNAGNPTAPFRAELMKKIVSLW